MAIAQWEWDLCDPNGVKLAGLEQATGRKLDFKRNSFGEATCAIRHEDSAATRLLELLASGSIPTLKCWRRAPGAASSTLRFNGYMAPMQETVEESAVISLTFRGPFSRLKGDGTGRGRYTGPLAQATAKDAGLIAAELVRLYGGRRDGAVGGTQTTLQDAAGNLAYAETAYCGLDIGAITATVVRDRTYQSYNVGEAITNLANVLDGFDFAERFVDEGTTLAYLDIFARQGQDRPGAKFEYGADTLRNVRSVSRTTEPPVNYVRFYGANGLVSVQEAPTGRTPDGFYTQTRTDISVQETLDAYAKALLRPHPIQTVTWEPEPSLAPAPFDDYGLGDTVHFYARRGPFVVSTPARVNSFTVTIDDNGYEAAGVPDPLDPEGEAVLRASLTTEASA